MITNNLAFRRKLAGTFPGIYLVPVGLRSAVVISQADYCREVLVRTDDFDKPQALTKIGRPVFGNGILTAENKVNRTRRRLVQPIFKHHNVSIYSQLITEYTDKLVEGWTDDHPLNVVDEMTKLTMQIIGAVMFSIPELGDKDQLGRDIHTALKSVSNAFLFPLPFRDQLPQGRRTNQAIARLNATLYQMIAARRTDRGEHTDLLNLLLDAHYESGIGLTDEEIRDEIMTIFIAGHETVTLALSWALYRLACHPAIQERTFQEMDRTLKGRLPTLEDLPQLPYTLQLFKESLRFYPPGHVMIRMAMRDTTLDGFHIPGGAIVLLDIYAMHHRPEYFSRPGSFNPDRFAAQNESMLPRYTYLPFGTGPRVCIGQHFAIMEAHLILATLVQHKRFERGFDHPIKPRAELTLRPSHPIVTLVHKRSNLKSTSSANIAAGSQ